MSITTYIFQLLPTLLFLTPSLIPSMIAFVIAWIYFKNGKRFGYFNFAAASIISAAFAFGLLNFCFRAADKDANGALIFVVLPFYCAVIAVISLLFGVFLKYVRRRDAKQTIPQKCRPRLFFIPVIFYLLFFAVVIVDSKNEIEMSAAGSASTPTSDLRSLYEKAMKENNDGILLFLAQNEKTPADILEGMSHVPFAHVRVFVAKHPNTPIDVVKKMTQDENDNVRRFALEEIQRRASKNEVLIFNL